MRQPEEIAPAQLNAWREAHRHSVENGGPVSLDQIGEAAVDLEHQIIGCGETPHQVLEPTEAAQLRRDIDQLHHRREMRQLSEAMLLDRSMRKGHIDSDRLTAADLHLLDLLHD